VTEMAKLGPPAVVAPDKDRFESPGSLYVVRLVCTLIGAIQRGVMVGSFGALSNRQ
jgi:hypothetical protein